MLQPLLHQSQIHTTRPVAAAGLRSSIVMRHLAIHIIVTLLLIGICQARTGGRDLSKESSVLKEDVPHSDSVDDVDSKKEDSEEDRMPILPPIILLDFGNGTEEENVTSEEKSKRTVNSGLGYGLDKNSLHPRKYNYYFPAGKSGTTVSIEESVSPFLPKTIIERVRPNSQSGIFGTQQNTFSSSYSATQAQAQSQQDPRYSNLHQSSKSHAAFGLRTKPQKILTSAGLSSYQSYGATPKPQAGSFGIHNSGYRVNEATTTQSPLVYSSTETVNYVTPSSVNFANPQSGSFSYSNPSSHLAGVSVQSHVGGTQQPQPNVNSHSFGGLSSTAETSTASPLSYNSHFASPGSPGLFAGPKYTVENGLRYENKIFWKYPDGRVSETPPATYVETYSQYPQPETKAQPESTYEADAADNGGLSQGSAQFPSISELNGQEPSAYASSQPSSSSLSQQDYHLDHQNLLSQRHAINLAQLRKPSNLATSYSSSSLSLGRTKLSPTSQKTEYASPYQQTTSRYMVNSPNAEYTYTTESTVSNSTSPNSFPSIDFSRVSSKYTPKVQSYLGTTLGGVAGSKTESPDNDLNSYPKLQYSDLLNYNPSISEYIRNPQSILNVRPTLVQAGNSLIPVIILRVDGVAPIQAKASQNINLKALLQQYLIQYANSIQELAQPSSYDLGGEAITKDQRSESSQSPVLDLIKLTQEDARQAPSYMSNSYIGRSSYEASNLQDPIDYLGSHYGERTSGRHKAKNVQILDDVRYATYKTKN